jgi:hypothetical protein
MTDEARWWTLRRAQNLKPATYTCPLCRRRLASMEPHALIAPEGDMSRRRHAHLQCVARAQLPTRDDWLKAQPKEPGFFARLLRRSQ